MDHPIQFVSRKLPPSITCIIDFFALPFSTHASPLTIVHQDSVPLCRNLRSRFTNVTMESNTARQKVVRAALGWINQLGADQLRAVLRGFVTGELAFSDINLIMMVNVLQSTNVGNGLKSTYHVRRRCCYFPTMRQLSSVGIMTFQRPRPGDLRATKRVSFNPTPRRA